MTDEPVSLATFIREVGRLGIQLNNIQIMMKKVYRNTSPMVELTTEETEEETWPALPLASEDDS